MTYRTPLSLLSAILLLVLLAQSVFIVPQGSMGVILRLESPTTLDLKPGAHLKLPFLDKPLYLDAAGILLDSDSLNGGYLKFVTADRETLAARYSAIWRIRDTAAFCTMTVCDENATARELNGLIVTSLRDIFAGRSMAAAIADQQDLVAGLAKSLAPAAGRFGVELQSVRLTGVELPPAGLEDVYTRMRSAEEARAAQVASEGAARAARKRAETDAERDQILAGADAAAARIRASGEADAVSIYALAARPDPDFFSFYQGLAAYRRSLTGKTILVLDADSPFLKYLQPPQK
ncbi:MAG TPA: SPFH domain-containing protein [Gammaproteobacteria bacterium]|nr:SPFH domain-containing protein [Gammaproteobacteria bacterium]